MRPTFDSPAHAIAVFDGIHRALAGTADLKQIKALRDQAEAVRRYATTAALGLEMQNRAMEMRLAVERRAGEVLRDMQLRGGDRKSGRQDDTRLEGLGITKEESFRWQREASLPETDFREYLRVAKENGKKLTSRGLLDLARVHARDTRSARENLFGRLVAGLRKLARQGSEFGCIHVIPPWPEGHVAKVDLCRFIQELLDLPVEPVAAKKAHLHLWTPPEMLEDGPRLVRAWGFKYQASLVRTKAPAERGSYWRQAHDVLLLGVRGELGFPDNSMLSWLDPRTDSAADVLCEIRSLIGRASPGPYLELFGGNATRMWKVLSS